MLGKLFGGKKSKDGFYVQLDDALDGKQTDNSNGKKVTTTVVEEKKVEPAPTKAAVVEEKKTAAPATAKKATNKKGKSKTETAPAAPAPKKVAEDETPFWVKAMNANTSNGKKAPESVESFASKYLMPTPNRSRRRPGPSLNPFMDMARQVKNSNSQI
ncbi:MAG: hypothetical protein ACRC2R_04145 [Xenococcaceae cyanobacterium]